MLTKADDYPIHQTPDPIAYAGTDRNFYDRYFFHGYSVDGNLFFAAALGVYPHLNIMDAAFCLRIGTRQYNLNASRHLNMERMDTQVGPIRVEVIEPLKRLRVAVDDNEHGITADIVFEGRAAPVEEPRAIRRNGPRTLQDFTRLTQFGSYSGWVRAGGQEIRFENSEVVGVRDRSWGVRHVGERDPQPMVPAQEHQFHWFWIPAVFEDRTVLFYLNEDGNGAAWNAGLVIARDGAEAEHFHDAKLDFTYHPGTRWPATGTLTAPDGHGGTYRIDLQPGARFFMTGLGYMSPDWSHGVNKGPLAVGYHEIDKTDTVEFKPPHTYVEAFTNLVMTTPEGQQLKGVGVWETLSMGRYAPLGLTGMFDTP